MCSQPSRRICHTFWPISSAIASSIRFNCEVLAAMAYCARVAMPDAGLQPIAPSQEDSSRPRARFASSATAKLCCARCEGIDTSNATGRMVAGVLASLAELELELAGNVGPQRERRVGRGQSIGRPRHSTVQSRSGAADARERRSAGTIAATLGVSRQRCTGCSPNEPRLTRSHNRRIGHGCPIGHRSGTIRAWPRGIGCRMCWACGCSNPSDTPIPAADRRPGRFGDRAGMWTVVMPMQVLELNDDARRG